jgi:type II secretory pathway pseudopilin PulG
MVVTPRHGSTVGRPAACPRWQRHGRDHLKGLSLVELLVATAIGAFLLAGMGSVARLGVAVRAETGGSIEALQQARFALERVQAAARATAPHALLPAAANTSGNVFSPAYFCVNAGGSLVETTTADTGCTGTQVVAEHVSSFVLTPAVAGGALAAESATVAVTVAGPGGGGEVTLSEHLRLGGGER